MGRGKKMTPQQKGKRSKGEFAMIPFLDLVDLVDMVDMKIHFQYFPFLTMTFFIKTGTDHQLNNLRRPRCT